MVLWPITTKNKLYKVWVSFYLNDFNRVKPKSLLFYAQSHFSAPKHCKSILFTNFFFKLHIGTSYDTIQSLDCVVVQIIIKILMVV